MQNEKTPAQTTQGDELQVFTNLMKILVPQTTTGYQYAIFEDNVPPLGGPPPHSHPDEEIFYILEGEFEFILNDLYNPFRVEAGSVIHVPSNALHTFKNVGQTAGKMLGIVTPGSLEQYFRQVGKPITNENDRPNLNVAPDLSKLDVARAFELAPGYGITFYLPELAN